VLGRRACEDMVKGWPGSENPMARLMNGSISQVLRAGLTWDPLPQRVDASEHPICQPSDRLFDFSLRRRLALDRYRHLMPGNEDEAAE
jgi:hypothetical protein